MVQRTEVNKSVSTSVGVPCIGIRYRGVTNRASAEQMANYSLRADAVFGKDRILRLLQLRLQVPAASAAAADSSSPRCRCSRS